MWKIVKRILDLSGNYANKIKVSFLFCSVDGIFESFPILAIFYLFDGIEKAIGENIQLSSNTIWLSIGILFCGLIGRIIFKYFAYRFQGTAGYSMVAKERLKIGDQLRRLPMGFFNQNNLGEITTTITTDLQYIEKHAAFLLDKISNCTINVLATSIIICIFDLRIGILFIIGLLLSLIVINIMQKKSIQLFPKQKFAETEAVSATLEFIQGISVFKLFNIGSNHTNRTKKAYETYDKKSCEIELKFVPFNILFMSILKIICGVIIFTAAYLSLNGQMSVVKMLIIVIATFSIFAPIEAIGGIYSMMHMLEASLKRVEKVKNFPEIDRGAGNIPILKHDIEFENVSFAYEDKNNILSDLTFKIPERTMTAIVGVSGCGKTTIMRMIARFWDVQSGSVKIGGVDVKNMTCDSLLQNITMVFQNVYLFHDSILNNIKFGNPNVSREDIIKAARKARCHVFIMNLDDGYDTVVDEGGGNLSGGEKQRISIARAILKDAPIILLDEATSSLDPENEQQIQKAINELVRNKTVVVIAHRLSTIRDADQILVMENGRVAEHGTHKQLIKKSGTYKNLWDARMHAADWTVLNS
ncbi:MAG: ABC transporter ATP-binding protein/permease [Clostridium sp.]|jgi:ATP-binding cassette subfamily B protein|uniref:ABC transporter ATP-binding protein n=1 Tax=Clostridium sp. TaxID=1506 RepID=UPI0025BF5517|nr:ABC transporter ATP-binding protein [Clostridium sp.]MCH3964483.1 ABC transporter ATP-binding protein/permease [Clostridium sp.]MCI1714955.1 ABC transporter ATP-binding protein/permease [Clostridium sp.]MCI1799217.1 ABC transporter ATP-binding protein/permease [Clostridium sp.]MCI1813138.1 ABC transporter ATP-binding protein/permease [Clostridium sp.]MCI1870028.1 ABC transporter ATP-binding protein/permease [Clostridium sp.]